MSESNQPSRALPFLTDALIGLLFVVFFGVTIFFLETQPDLYCDEAISLLYASMSWERLFEVLHQDTHGPLHYVWLKVLLSRPNPISPNFERFWGSILFGAITIVIVYLLGQKLGGQRVGLMAAFLLATSCFNIFFNQWVRMYALSGFLAVAAAYYAVSFFQVPERRRQSAIGYVLFATALLYTHYMAFPFIAALNIALFLAARLQSCKATKLQSCKAASDGANQQTTQTPKHLNTQLTWLALQAIVLLLFLPWVKVLVGHVKDVWRSFAIPEVTPFSVLNVFKDFSLFAPSVHERSWHSLIVLCVGALVYGWLFLCGLAASRPLGFRSVPAVTLLVSIIIVYLISLRRPLFESRVLFLVCPFYYLVLAQGLEAHRPALRRLLMTATLALNLLSLGYYAFSPVYAKTSQWREVAIYLKVHRLQSEPVMHTSVLSFPTLVYHLGSADGHKVIGLSFENATASTRFPLLISPKSALPDVDGFLQKVNSFWLIEQTDWRPWAKRRPYQSMVEKLAKKPGWSLKLVRSWRGVRLYSFIRRRCILRRRAGLEAPPTQGGRRGLRGGQLPKAPRRSAHLRERVPTPS